MQISVRALYDPLIAAIGWFAPVSFRNAATLPFIRDKIDDALRSGEAYTAGVILRAIASTSPGTVVLGGFGVPSKQPPLDNWADNPPNIGEPTCLAEFLQQQGGINQFKIFGGFAPNEPIKIKQGTADIATTTADATGFYDVTISLVSGGYFILYAEGQTTKRVSKPVILLPYLV